MNPITRPTSDRIWVGIDLGTSGCRAVVIDEAGRELASARTPLAAPLNPAPGQYEQDPELWWKAVLAALTELATALPGRAPVSICVDATSATLLLARADGKPCGPALMYNDRRAVTEADLIDRAAPTESPARGPSASLAKLVHLSGRYPRDSAALALHQADWIIGRLTGHPGVTDWNNALKLGYDAERLRWPDWVSAIIPDGIRLPKVVAPGDPIGSLDAGLANRLGWPSSVQVLAGTTDSTAAVIAAGAQEPGDAVTSLGSTLVLKILSERPVTASAYGIYSHRFGDAWLVGGASNSGGAVLRRSFSDAEIVSLSLDIDPERPSGLDYYPLLGPGERFPRNDPDLTPRLSPRPSEPRDFLHGLLEGIARIEAEGYGRLAELGAPPPRRIASIGGGAINPTWTAMRSRLLGIPVTSAAHQDAAYGAALLALHRREQ
ncbi:FGGY-family carbohydrate kinase [Thiocapsa marina]|uniref:Xylulokinase n=1 Tax=Thiocapsa marina 5811 TaxID=768671 RepID=F9U5P3_9GAMM|nr:FGGY-family carbohydrate kinase [Thiocapsa marina]EGV20466.1 Xylulokinase [Thiocapsa marina 5811]